MDKDLAKTPNKKSASPAIKFLLVWGGTLVLTAILSLSLVHFVNRVLLNRLVDDKANYLEYFYNFNNALKPADGDSYPPFHNKLAIVDVGDLCGSDQHERLAIARLIDTLYSFDPAVIGLDLLFPDSIETNPEDDLELLRTVERCKDKLVVAARNYDGKLKHSFFTVDTGVDFGTVNGSGFFFVNLSDIVDDSLPVDKLVAVMAKKAGLFPGDDTLSNGIVDFRSRNIDKQTVNTRERLEADFFRGKVVLVGDFKDSRDLENLPFRVDGETTMPGSGVQAYTLSSILSPGRCFHLADCEESVFWFILFITFYSFFFVLLSIMENNKIEMKLTRGLFYKTPKASYCLNIGFLLLKPLLLILMTAGYVSFCICKLEKDLIVIDMLAFFVAEVLIIDFIYKIMSMTFNRFFTCNNQQ